MILFVGHNRIKYSMEICRERTRCQRERERERQSVAENE